ncbi:MAG: hypothetical protein K0Q49_1578, partial [Haloplasmataceae bacterium]|nr:hypothetical protein [Haloplasmataceae bacterium]
MLKKIFSLLLVSVFGITLLACSNTTTSEEKTTATTQTSATTVGSTDKIPPAFVGAVQGKLQAVEQLKGEEIDLLEGVQARDNVVGTDVEIAIINYGGYDKEIPGEYTITIQAEDEVGNKSTVEKIVTVLPTITRTFDALKIGESIVEYSYNNTIALEYENVLGYGLIARTTDVVQLMTKEFFVAEYNEHKTLHAENGNVPYLPYGVLVITDEDLKVQLVRLDIGILA